MWLDSSKDGEVENKHGTVSKQNRILIPQGHQENFQNTGDVSPIRGTQRVQ